MNIPPDRIETLKDVLWYLIYYSKTIPVVRHGQASYLGNLDIEEWCEQVAYWIQNNQLPAREILEDEAERTIKEIENAKTTSFTVDPGADDRRCCGGKRRGDDHK